jgi:hypothetical protein
MMEKCCDPDSPTEKCVVCGETIHTCERETSINDSYLCPIKSHNNGTESIGGLWVCDKCGDEYLYQDHRKWYDNIDIKWFHPFNFVGIKKPKFEHPSDDIYEYGFSLDLTTEIYYYTYDWGKGFNFRILGLGFEITKLGR